MFSGFIYNCLKLEATKMFFHKQMNKQTAVHLYNGVLFDDKKRNELQSNNNNNKPEKP